MAANRLPARLPSGRPLVGRSRLGLGGARQRPVDLEVKIEQFPAQLIKSGLELGYILLGGKIDEIKERLDVAVEKPLVGKKALARPSQPPPHFLVRYDFVEKARRAFLAQLAQTLEQILRLLSCHEVRLYIGRAGAANLMEHLATVASVASGFFLMRYKMSAADTLATALAIDTALAPLTAVIASRRRRRAALWAAIGLVFGMWALAAVLLIPSARGQERAPAKPEPPHTSDAA